MWQKDRQYLLEVDNKSGKGLQISGLQIEFSVQKSSDSKKNPSRATVKIYNLSTQNQSYFEKPFVEVVLSVGYIGVGMNVLFAGQATIVGTSKQGADTITEVELDTLYSNLNHKRISRTTPAGVTVKSVIETTIGSMEGVTNIVFSGDNTAKSFIDGYPLTGSPREILNALSEAFDLEWNIDNGTLYVMDVGSSYTADKTKAYVLSESSGLIERPYYDNVESRRSKKDAASAKRKGVKLKILLNPMIIPGSMVKIEYAEFTGFYKVERIRHDGSFFGDNWTTELVCGTMIK